MRTKAKTLHLIIGLVLTALAPYSFSEPSNLGLYCPPESLYYCPFGGSDPEPDVGGSCWTAGWQCSVEWQITPLPDQYLITVDDLGFYSGFVFLMFVTAFGTRKMIEVIKYSRGY